MAVARDAEDGALLVVAEDTEDARVVRRRGEEVDQCEPRRGVVRVVSAHGHDAAVAVVDQLGVVADVAGAHHRDQRGEGRLVLGAEPVVDRRDAVAVRAEVAVDPQFPVAVGRTYPVAVAPLPVDVARDHVAAVLKTTALGAVGRILHDAVLHFSSFRSIRSSSLASTILALELLLASFWLHDHPCLSRTVMQPE